VFLFAILHPPVKVQIEGDTFPMGHEFILYMKKPLLINFHRLLVELIGIGLIVAVVYLIGGWCQKILLEAKGDTNSRKREFDRMAFVLAVLSAGLFFFGCLIGWFFSKDPPAILNGIMMILLFPSIAFFAVLYGIRGFTRLCIWIVEWLRGEGRKLPDNDTD
jgi:F0F1-type ATP synthase membrane subunit c/vacuolar-type H+-ATPase subunit K